MRHLKGLLLVWIPVVLVAQPQKTVKARLSPVPIDVAMQATVAGSGTVTATLAGTKLSISGVFEALKSPATIAQVHKSPARGVRGPVVFDLTVTKTDDASGTLAGTFTLTPLQVQEFDKGLLYVQLHSAKAPDGNLWGWIIPQESRR